MELYRGQAKSLLLFCLLLIIEQSQQSRDFYFQLHTCEATSLDPKNCEVNCTLSRKGDVLGVTGYMNILEPTDTGGLSVELAGRRLGGSTYVTVINATVQNACSYLISNSRSNLLQIGIDELIKSGKVPNCPVEKGVYYIKDYYISPDYFPPVLPEGDFRAKGTIFGDRKNGERFQCARYSITGSIRLKKNSLWGRITNKN